MDQSWVKLHRQTLDNIFLMKDGNAFCVFIKLLMMVNKKTGEYAAGRRQLAELMDIKDRTLYDVLIRLEKHGMITITSNARFSVIKVNNWSKFQNRGEDSTPTAAPTAKKQIENPEPQPKTQPLPNQSPTAAQHSNKNKKEKENSKGADAFVILIPELKTELTEFINHRKNARKPMTPYAFGLLQKKLIKLYEDTERQRTCINLAIENGWSTVWPLKQHEIDASNHDDKVDAIFRRMNEAPQ